MILYLIFSKKDWYLRNKERILAKAKKNTKKKDLAKMVRDQEQEINQLKDDLMKLKDEII